MLVDSHCHLDCLDLTPYEGDLNQVLLSAKQNDVTYFLCVCINLNDFPAMMQLISPFDNIFASVGLHPNENPGESLSVERLVELASNAKIIAIGETGLDYYRSQGDIEWQRERFRSHIAAAKLTKKPLIIHTRDAAADTLAIMREEKANEIGGVMHCFTEDWAIAQQAMELGFYISISGIVTFNNAKQVHDVATKVPLEKLLIETDSPYLAPVPFRGKPNQPAYVKYVAEKIAQLKGISYQEVAEQTTENFYSLFKPPAFTNV